MMNVGLEKVYLMYNPAIYETADVISTYTYRRGIENAEYSYSSAVGLFNSVCNFVLLIIGNYISKRISNEGIW
jgi:putative aldouronate transport system permease protein